MQSSKDAEMKKQEQEQVVELGSDITKSQKGNIYTLTIIGQVEGHQVAPETVKTTKYEHVLPLLAGIEENDEVDGLLLLLNTVGGDIEAGLAIAELISGMRKPTVSLVLGGGHSIGVPLAVAARRCMIAQSASMTIHPVRMTEALRKRFPGDHAGKLETSGGTLKLKAKGINNRETYYLTFTAEVVVE